MKIEEIKGVTRSDPDILGGTPVFVGTRVPVQNLIDVLEASECVEAFIEGFPSVRREQVVATIAAMQA